MSLSQAIGCRDRLFAEIRVLKQLKHKNIMTFYDSWLDQKTYSVNFITEMFTSGTLRQYVLLPVLWLKPPSLLVKQVAADCCVQLAIESSLQPSLFIMSPAA